MNTFIRLIAIVAIAGFAQYSWSQSHQGQRVLKLNHTDTPSGARHQAAERFAAKVEEYSAGRFRVLVFHSGQLGNDPQSIKAVSEGRLDFTTSATGSFASLVAELNLTALPYLVEDYEQGWRFYDEGPWMRQQFDKLPAKGLRHLATWEAGFRSFTTRFAFSTPADARGKRMRVFPNDMIKWIMESVGFEPVVLPVTEVYAAMAQGRVDGQENPIDTIRALRFHEVAPNIALTEHVYSPLPFVMSETLWKTLNGAEREQFMRAAREASTVSRRLVRDADELHLQAMRSAGATVTRPDRAPFRFAMQAVYVRARAIYGAEVDGILKDALAARPK